MIDFEDVQIEDIEQRFATAAGREAVAATARNVVKIIEWIKSQETTEGSTEDESSSEEDSSI